MAHVLIFISLGCSKELFPFLSKHCKNTNPFTPINYSERLFDAITAHYDVSKKILVPSIGAYPTHSDLAFVFKKYGLSKYSFCNIWGARNISIANSAIRYCKKRILPSLNKDDVYDIVAVEMHYPILAIASFFKKRLKKSHLTIVVPDLPDFMSSNQGIFYRFFKKFDNQKINRISQEQADGYLLFTEEMNAVVNKNNKPYFVFEGIADLPFQLCANKESNKKRIVYTGATDLNYSGLDIAISAIKRLRSEDQNYELIVAGSGGGDELLKKEAGLGNLQFLGVVSPEQSIDLQKSASVLICLRRPGEMTKYSFPSKIMEYLRTGHPIVCSNLQGMPREYFSVLTVVDPLTAENVAIAIKNCVSEESFESDGRRQRINDLLSSKTKDQLLSDYCNLISQYS